MSRWWQHIKDSVYNAYTGILDYLKSPFVGLSQYFKNTKNEDKENIEINRQQHYQLIEKELQNPNPDFNHVTKKITADTKAYLNKIIDEEIKKLGKPPVPFSIMTFGSLARQETGPITDLEIGYLVKEKTVPAYQYLNKLTQNISDRLFLLGEHPDIGGKGLRMDEANNAPIHLRFFARNATREQTQELMNEAIMNREFDKIPYEGSRPYIATPEEFAQYSNLNFKQDRLVQKNKMDAAFDKAWKEAVKDPKNAQKIKTPEGRQELGRELNYWVGQMHRPFNQRELKIANDAGKTMARNVAHLYGDPGLYKDYMSKRDKVLNQKEKNGLKVKQIVAKNKLREDIKSILQKGKGPFLTGELGKTLDIKRGLYRFPEQFLTNLGLYHSCKSQNTFEIAKELISRGVLSPEFGANLMDFMNFATGLKLKEQSILKRQGFDAYFDQDKFNEDKEDLVEEIDNTEKAIAYLKTVKDDVALKAKERELLKLKSKLEHLEEMAPGKIYSQEDIANLKKKLPFAKEIFAQAIAWTKGQEKFGFAPKMQPEVQPQEQKAQAPIVHAYNVLTAPKLVPVAKKAAAVLKMR